MTLHTKSCYMACYAVRRQGIEKLGHLYVQHSDVNKMQRRCKKFVSVALSLYINRQC